jgi:UDP-N-acetylglucosamine:LPS N-acetylglucosamine transferase
MAEPSATRLLLVCSGGGHLAQLLTLAPWWERHERTWVTSRTPDAESRLLGEDVVWAYFPTTRNLPNAVRNLGLAFSTLRSRHPDVVVSNGAGVAAPFFAAARAKHIPTVYVEVYDRIETRTLTGRLCRPMSSLFCVQWPEQKALYPGATVIGPLL